MPDYELAECQNPDCHAEGIHGHNDGGWPLLPRPKGKHRRNGGVDWFSQARPAYNIHGPFHRKITRKDMENALSTVGWSHFNMAWWSDEGLEQMYLSYFPVTKRKKSDA